jgi:hypothetical protein
VTLWLCTGGGPDILVEMTREDHAPPPMRTRAIYLPPACGTSATKSPDAWQAFTDASLKVPQPCPSCGRNARETAGGTAGGDRGGSEHAENLKLET